MDFEKKLSCYVNRFEEKLNLRLNALCKDSPKIIREAIAYAISNGGKRIRPVILYATCDCLGVNLDYVDNFALALEMIHSYSLVHDDLPSMDNDDYRRGKLSTHKKYGEAIGVLTGDALLNLAFETAFEKDSFSNFDFKAIKLLAEYAGYNGMIAGQVLDLEAENNKNLSLDNLTKIHLNKTAKLLTVPLLISSIFADNKYYEELKKLGEILGLIFQITDDILDVEGTFDSLGKTTGKDEKENKLTSVSLLGLKGAKTYNLKLHEEAIKILKSIENSDFLLWLENKIFNRKK